MIIAVVGGVITIFTFLFTGWYGFIPLVLTIILDLLPLEGFEDPQCELVNIIKINAENLYNDSEQDIYLVKDEKYVTYARDISNKYDINAELYDEVKVNLKSKNVRIFESDECKKPILKIYTSDSDGGDWCFCPFATREYVFFVPKGSVYTKK